MGNMIENQIKDNLHTQEISESENAASVAIDNMKINESEHPNVIVPQELNNVVAKGSDAQELELPEEVSGSITTPNGDIYLPMTYVQALEKKKTTSFWDSMHWLASLMIYQWKKYDPDISKAVKTKTKTH